MHQELHPYFLFFIAITFILIYITGSLCQDLQFIKCFETFRCGNMDIDYPFWGEGRPNYCGGHSSFEIKCGNNSPKIAFESTTYEVIGIHRVSRILTLARDDLLSNTCLDKPENDSLDLNIFSYVSSDQNITLYFNCDTRSHYLPMSITPYMFPCDINQFSMQETIIFGTIGDPTFGPIGPNGPMFNIYKPIGVRLNFSQVTCQGEIITRVNQTNAAALTRVNQTNATDSEELLKTAIAGGFSVNWTASIDSNCLQCDRSGGRCGSNPDFTAFACHCADGTHPTDCYDGQNQGGGNLLNLT